MDPVENGNELLAHHLYESYVRASGEVWPSAHELFQHEKHAMDANAWRQVAADAVLYLFPAEPKALDPKSLLWAGGGFERAERPGALSIWHPGNRAGMTLKSLPESPPATGLPPHQQRVVDEKEALDEKLEKLSTFKASNPIYFKLPDAEQHRLARQLVLMMEYSEVLGERIAAFPSAT